MKLQIQIKHENANDILEQNVSVNMGGGTRIHPLYEFYMKSLDFVEHNLIYIINNFYIIIE